MSESVKAELREKLLRCFDSVCIREEIKENLVVRFLVVLYEHQGDLHKEALLEAKQNGHEEGFEAGFMKGTDSAYEAGFDDGYRSAAYYAGYDQGFADGVEERDED